MDSKGQVYVADRSNNRIQIFDQAGKFLNQWTNFGTPWGLFIKKDLIYVVDGTENNCLLIATTKDGRVLEKIEGLKNPTAVAVDSNDAIYVGEVNGTNVKKFVKKQKVAARPVARADTRRSWSRRGPAAVRNASQPCRHSPTDEFSKSQGTQPNLLRS